MSSPLYSSGFAFLFLAASLILNAADQPDRKRVALVIDDGPAPEQNAALLALLARENVRVTFSHVGSHVVANPEMARAAAAAGHEIVNHSYTHPHFKVLDDAAITKEVNDTQDAIRQATNHTPVWFWAPYLEWDERIAAAVRRGGLEYYPLARFHLIDSKDWDATTEGATFRQRATTDIRDGTVLLCHEWPKVTLENLPVVLAELKRQGVEFVTFSELAK